MTKKKTKDKGETGTREQHKTRQPHEEWKKRENHEKCRGRKIILRGRPDVGEGEVGPTDGKTRKTNKIE